MEDLNQVTVADMMLCRDRRAAYQNELIENYHQPVVSFCLNIPGPVKTDEEIRRAFETGKEEILKALKNTGHDISKTIELHEKTGDELLMAVDCDAKQLKDLMSRIEDEHALGRLFDIDVIGLDGMKLSRARYRTCLICGKQAQDCARARTHSAAELFAKVKEMISGYYADR